MSAPQAIVHGGSAYGVPAGSDSGQAPHLDPRLNAVTCVECGADFDRVGQHGAFCSTRCRAAWNNRRLTRGAELYDLFMAIRFERRRSRTLMLWTALCRAASLFRQADLEERAGRRSWGEPTEVLARRPYLRTKILVRARPRQPAP